MFYDLLIDPVCTVFAVNCRVEGSTLHCGALYLDPLVPYKSIRLAYAGATLDVQLPLDLLNQPAPYRAWNVELSLSHEPLR